MRLSLLLAALWLAAPGAAAVLPVASAFGADSATRSTATGFDWLDLDRSYGGVRETDLRLTPGGDLASWRRATTDEVVAFWADAGVSVTGTGADPDETTDPAQLAAVLALQQLVSLTIPMNPSLDLSVGYTAEAATDPELWTVAHLFSRFDSLAGEYFSAGAIIDDTRALAPPFPDSESWGSWLVRPFQVPEPAAAPLFGLLAAVLVSRSRRARGGGVWRRL